MARDLEQNSVTGQGLSIYENRPKREPDWWNGIMVGTLPWDLFPDLKWVDAPMEVEITIRKKMSMLRAELKKQKLTTWKKYSMSQAIF